MTKPDPDGAKILERDAEGNLVETRPKHHVDPHAETEAVTPSEPRKRPKTLSERLEDLMRASTKIEIATRSQGFHTGTIVEVTDEVIVLKKGFNGKEKSATVLLDAIESYIEID